MICYVRKVNYYETDQMGIVHHSNHIRYFEEARLFWMEEYGILYSELEKMGIVVPVISVDCQYKIPLRYGDCVGIKVCLVRFDGIKLKFAYEIADPGTGKIHAEGQSSHCFLNADMKPILIRKKQPEIYQKVVAALKEDGGVGRKDMR